jgi:WD40 repeat protein
VRRRLLILLAILAAALPAGAQSRVTLSIGHSAPVTDMVTIPNRGVAVSAARDASLRVWDLERGALMESYQLPPIPVLRLAAHPDGEHLAVLQSDNRSHHQISVMAWATGDILYSVQVPARPIYFGYSPQGTYLLYSLPAYRSLFFLDSASGSERTYLNAGFGIVGFVQISASEQYVMTYIPSRGQIIYFELQTGGEEHRTSTERNLEHLTALSGRHLVGYRENTLYVVDNYDGSVEDSTPAVGVRSITVDGDQIVVLSQSGTRTEVNRYTYSGTSLQRSYYRAIGLEPEPRVIRAVPRSDRDRKSVV